MNNNYSKMTVAVGRKREGVKQDDQRIGMIYVVKTKTEDGGSPTPEDNDGSGLLTILQIEHPNDESQ